MVESARRGALPAGKINDMITADVCRGQLNKLNDVLLQKYVV